MKPICCKKCLGHYVIRSGKYGVFSGCSNFPKCKSSISLAEFVYTFFEKNGINIYGWDRSCWKCHQSTTVYSYYPLYDLGQLEPFFEPFSGMGLNDLPTVDKYLSIKYPTIKLGYSRTTKSKYIANHCERCGSIQGNNYVVEDPHEIFDSLHFKKDMQKYLVGTFSVDEINLPLSEVSLCTESIKSFFLAEDE